MAVPTLFLFDIDGTILLTGGAGRRSFERAFTEVTGRPDALETVSFGGMTDKGIARQGLEAAGIEVTDERVEKLFEAYLKALAIELQSSKYTIMPGVHDVLAKLKGLAHTALGLGTGNLKLGAEAKLRHGKLWEHFSFGGFGCDHELRGELLRAGAVRGAQQLGVPLEACRIVVIGDTVRDVDAAKEIGAECIGVETGGVSAEDLRARGAHAVYRDLTDPRALESLLGR
ncbi:MAG TPA: HAD family hydrolase [Polyangiales bacterium]|nr:HAD family hydrolase [Polyangiales bacterium]